MVGEKEPYETLKTTGIPFFKLSTTSLRLQLIYQALYLLLNLNLPSLIPHHHRMPLR